MENKIITKEEYKEWVINYLQTNNIKLSEVEVKNFLMLCITHNLNPLKGEIYAIKYKDKFNVITNYYIYLKKADETGLLDYYNIDIKTNDNGVPTGIGTFVGKRKDQSKEITMKFFFNEWRPKFTGSLWDTKPYFMFEKCILANGLRRMFPNELGNMPYVNEELWYQNSLNEQIIEEHVENDNGNLIELLKEDDNND